ncbi:probable serine/threonine-protein kinase PBL11 isoform X2 [Oryza brachyantha]|uniref:probable serine/threonine-protein kinase PBL11 isoform X2 n=1 Tax=Oryza brachyantha TaxID=4533 RepID=UPI001ADB2949|nr:probable serine/threonine-protein kinase PBL11 isoform X2 [Oryza brachyantha]
MDVTAILPYQGCSFRSVPWRPKSSVNLRDTDIVFIRIGATSVSSSSSSNSKITYSDSLRKRFAFLSAQAAASPERLAASGGEASRRPYAVAQCTRDLPSERCRACLEALSANASAGLLAAAAAEGELKSLSCRLRYSFTAVTTTTRRMAQSVDYSPSSGRSHGSSSSSMVVVIIGAVAAVVILVVLLVCFMRKRAKHPFGHQRMPKITETEMPNQQQKVNYSSAIMQSERRFSYAQLLAATDNFSPERKLGEGAFGAVYRGDLPPPPPTTTTEQQPVGVSVAVKRILRVNERALQDYENEIRVIGALSHPNLVPFVGSCSDNGELLLVYQLVRNRTLDYHLHGSDAAAALLTWQRRYKIALGMASALSYLHSNQPRVLHRDIKPGNVMLDEEFNAKVGDFGLVRIIPADGASCPMTVFGSSSYIDPEYCTTGRASAASDVYSFGAVLLEIASGDAPAADEFATSRRRNAVVDRFRALYAGGGGGAAALVDAADRRLNGEFDEEQMERLALVGLHCVQFDHRVRPSSEEVLGYLQGRLPVPPLEIKVPRRGAETSSTSRHQQAVHSLISIVE